MKFFVPGFSKAKQEIAYQGILDAAKEQMRWTIAPRRVFSLDYVHDKKDRHAQVGELDPLNHRYRVIAILESNAFIVWTQAIKGDHNLTVLVDKNEVHTIADFD